MGRFVFVCFLMLLSSTSQAQITPGEMSYRVFLSSDFNDKSSTPVNVKKHFSFQDDKIYVYIKWFNIADGEHKVHLETKDGSDQLVWVGGTTFTARNGSHNTWHWHNFHPELEQAGEWTIKLFLDGVYLETLSVNVTESS